MPESRLWRTAVRNFSHHPTRRVARIIGIGDGGDIDKAMDVIKRIAAEDDCIHKDPEPFVEVANLGDNAVELVVRVWADTGNYWPVKFAMTKAIKQTFDKEGISIPYPQRDVHIHQA